MKVVRVVAAVICDDIQTKHKIYATARGYGDYKGQWNFRVVKSSGRNRTAGTETRDPGRAGYRDRGRRPHRHH